MRKLKISIITFIAIIMMTALFVPQQGSANTELKKIERQLAELKRAKAEAQQKASQAQNRIRNIQVERNNTQRTIEELLIRISEAEQELAELTDFIESTESELEETEKQLVDAIERVIARDLLLKSRLQLMYTNGTVSYLEVLLSATSFSDFLDRYNNLQSLVGQDKDLLESNIRDQHLIADKKLEVEEQLVQLTDLYIEQETLIDDLWIREKEAEVAIASLNQEEENLGDITEEQERLLTQFVSAESELLRKKQQLEVSFKNGKIAYPLPRVYRVSSWFGQRTDPITGRRGVMHNGIDFAAPNGTNILAAAPGVVITASWWGGYGNTVVINHGKDNKGNEVWTLYAHMRPNGIKVKQGQKVKTGDVIGQVGTTGNSTGYHLHFEVRLNEKAVNPRSYLNL